MRRVLTVFCLIVLLGFSIPAAGQSAQNQSETVNEQEIELRARDVGHALRCVVCQNQSIEESDASLAEDMRILVRAKMRQGASDEEVIDFMQERYGDFVLLEPPVQANTYVLWAMPFALLLLALIGYLRMARNRPDETPGS